MKGRVPDASRKLWIIGLIINSRPETQLAGSQGQTTQALHYTGPNKQTLGLHIRRGHRENGKYNICGHVEHLSVDHMSLVFLPLKP